MANAVPESYPAAAPQTANRYERPSPPNITGKDLRRQFLADIFGKEVQDAATYSYAWVTLQAGHIAVGLVACLVAALSLRWLGDLYERQWLVDNSSTVGTGAVFAVAALWESFALYNSVRKATKQFPLGEELLWWNAFTAWLYIALGATVAWLATTQWLEVSDQLLGILAVLLIASVGAPWWLRQKVIWQRAGLPYLFRLAEAPGTFDPDDAEVLQRLIDEPVPPPCKGSQIVIAGPIGSGRTALAAGIGTEFAFRRAKVRYLSFDALLELAFGSTIGQTPQFMNDPGPRNIDFWSWADAQVIIIDNIGPLIGNRRHGHDELTQFRTYLDKDLQQVRSIFLNCHSVWILGNLGEGAAPDQKTVDDFAKEIQQFCRAPQDALIIELSSEPATAPPPRRGPTVRKATVRHPGKSGVEQSAAPPS